MIDTVQVSIGESLDFTLEVETSDDLQQRFGEHLSLASSIMLGIGMSQEQVAEALDTLLSSIGEFNNE